MLPAYLKDFMERNGTNVQRFFKITIIQVIIRQPLTDIGRHPDESKTKSILPPNSSIDLIIRFSRSSKLVASAGMIGALQALPNSSSSPIRKATGVLVNTNCAPSS